MAITAVLVYAGHNRLRYLITSTAGGESIEIPSVGGATPDLLTDSLAGPLKQIARVKTQGYGLIPVGGITMQAQARALLLSDGNLAAVGPNKPTAICRLEQVSGTIQGLGVDAIQGSGDNTTPSLQVLNLNGIGGSAGYLDVEIPGAIGA
jgi:hypothetical protein